MPLVEQELLTLAEHLSAPPVFNGVPVTRSLVLYVCLLIVVCPFVLFLLAIVLSVLLRYTDSDHGSFGIFKLFLNESVRHFNFLSGNNPNVFQNELFYSI